MNEEHWILLLLWGLFGFFHSLFAAEGVKDALCAFLGRYARYYRLLYSLFALGSLTVVLVCQFSIKSIHLFYFPFLKYLVGLVVGLPGILLMIVCIRKYFFNLSGVQVFLRRDEKAWLETGGVHAVVRHPLYLGTLAALWSVFFFFPLLSNLLACFAITAYTLLGIRLEEKKLVRIYGKSYMVYRKRTPMLFPNLRLLLFPNFRLR